MENTFDTAKFFASQAEIANQEGREGDELVCVRRAAFHAKMGRLNLKGFLELFDADYVLAATELLTVTFTKNEEEEIMKTESNTNTRILKAFIQYKQIKRAVESEQELMDAVDMETQAYGREAERAWEQGDRKRAISLIHRLAFFIIKMGHDEALLPNYTSEAFCNTFEIEANIIFNTARAFKPQA